MKERLVQNSNLESYNSKFKFEIRKFSDFDGIRIQRHSIRIFSNLNSIFEIRRIRIRWGSRFEGFEFDGILDSNSMGFEIRIRWDPRFGFDGIRD